MRPHIIRNQHFAYKTRFVAQVPQTLSIAHLRRPDLLVPTAGLDAPLIPLGRLIDFASIAVRLRQIVHIALRYWLLRLFCILDRSFEQLDIPFEFVRPVGAIGVVDKVRFLNRDTATGRQVQILVSRGHIAGGRRFNSQATVLVFEGAGDLIHVIALALNLVQPRRIQDLEFHVGVHEKLVVIFPWNLPGGLQRHITRLGKILEFGLADRTQDFIVRSELFDKIDSIVGAACI